MTTATQINLDSIRETLAIRRSALADLSAMPAFEADSEWRRARVADVEFCNRTIARTAGRHGIEPAELIALAEMD